MSHGPGMTATLAAPSHPARYSAELVPILADRLRGAHRVLDPMGGTGERLREIADAAGIPSAVALELEPEWAAVLPGKTRGDACSLPFPAGIFDAVCVSPAYGNRFADRTHRWSNPKGRRSYSQALGRDLTAGSGAALQWGPTYRALHARAWAEAVRVLRPGGRFVLNVKDHYRGDRRQYVTDWHRDALTSLGLTLVERIEVPTSCYRNGANADARCPEEVLTLDASA